jgi:hypothetical protein
VWINKPQAWLKESINDFGESRKVGIKEELPTPQSNIVSKIIFPHELLERVAVLD